MKKLSACALTLAVFGCLSINLCYAEQIAPQRKFKTWTVEGQNVTVKQESKADSQWKKNLAASAAKKQTMTRANTAAVKQATVVKQSAAVKDTLARPAAVSVGSSKSVYVEKKPSANTQMKKASLRAAVKEKQKKTKLKYSDKATNITVKENGHVTYSDGWRMKNAQQKLRRLGYMTEYPSGKMTSATKLGLERFQKENGYSVTGKLDDRTYRKLEWIVFSRDGIKNLTGAAVVKEAAKYKGIRYVFGGTTPRGFDCSGYVQYVFKQLHAQVTRTADTQALEGVFVTQKQLKPGDLVFFTTYEPGASHCGIYAGNGKFWNATSSRGIALCGLQEDYWRTRYYGARRLLVSNGEPSI